MQLDLVFAARQLHQHVGLPSLQIQVTSEIQDIQALTLLQMREPVPTP